MSNLSYNWNFGACSYSMEMAFVEGTKGRAYLFGEAEQRRSIEVPGFFMATTSVTQALWTHVMGHDSNRSHFRGDQRPVENVSWDDITGLDGFLRWINMSDILAIMASESSTGSPMIFRLPSETEWEYAARGGQFWTDEFQFSGSNNVDVVAWYKGNSGNQTHEVAQKAANQLGLHDMCGNVWEWCQDCFTRDTSNIPPDGKPFVGPGSDRILRGGCHHNGAVHCTVSKRYEITREAHDECIGFRLVLSRERD